MSDVKGYYLLIIYIITAIGGGVVSTESLEFCSEAWVRCLQDYMTTHLDGLDLSGVTISFSEELTDPPAHLVHDGEDSAGWHYRVTDGVLIVEAAPLRDADRRMVGDYDRVVVLARLRYTDPAIGPLAQAALDDGTLRYEGDFSLADERVAAALTGMHDYLADRTA